MAELTEWTNDYDPAGSSLQPSSPFKFNLGSAQSSRKKTLDARITIREDLVTFLTKSWLLARPEQRAEALNLSPKLTCLLSHNVHVPKLFQYE